MNETVKIKAHLNDLNENMNKYSKLLNHILTYQGK